MCLVFLGRAQVGAAAIAFTLLAALGCSSSDVAAGPDRPDAEGGGWRDGPSESPPDGFGDASLDAAREPREGGLPEAEASTCPPDMVPVAGYCIDRYEAPNRAGAEPLVMYTFVEASNWCVARDKRLCFDDEWTAACQGPTATAYPYGNTHEPGACNDDKTWIAYDQSKLDLWPWNLQAAQIVSLSALLTAVRAEGADASLAADEVERLYQATPAGAKSGCGGAYSVFDLTGNAEEWTRRRDGGTANFHGSLKGRYWAEPRTCQSAVTTHGDGFRFYEIGFRCCKDA